MTHCLKMLSTHRLTGGNGHNIVLGLEDRKKAKFYLSGRIGLPRGCRENSSRSSAAVFSGTGYHRMARHEHGCGEAT